MKRFEGKKLLILGGLILECDIVRSAQRMGAYVIVADYNPNVPARIVADQFELISATDVPSLVDLCKREKIDGVVTGFIDILLQPCYEVCKEIGVPCYFTPKLLSMSTNKVDFKETCNKYGVPVPQTHYIGDTIPEDIYEKICYPVFVKPLDASGSRGAAVCYNKNKLQTQFAEAVGYSSNHKALIEDYISGREFLLDYIAVDGEYRLLSMFDRYMTPDRGSAVNYSNISMAPSNVIDFYMEEINDKVIGMFKSLGFKDGLFFLQGYSNGKKITFFEMGCRLGGSYYNHQRAILGYNALDMVVNYALTGKMTDSIKQIPLDVSKYNGKIALDCNYLLKGTNETIAEIRGLDEIEKMPCCVELQKYHDIGFHYSRERIVDIPIANAEIVVDSKEEVIEKVNYINRIFDVFNDKGESLLITKLEPTELFK